VINGQPVSGAYVTTGGQLQSFNCPSPQQYNTADGSSQGWACYEQTTGVWLLNALPPTPAPQAVPAPTTVPPAGRASSPPAYTIYPRRSPPVIYQAPPTVIYEPPPVVVYTRPAPPVVVYQAPPPYVVVAPRYPSSVILGSAAIEAAGRIASAVILNSRYSRDYVTFNTYEINRGRIYGRRR
jgi:hypothetical protein